MDEVWKDSFTYPEYFEVSNFGRVRRKPYSFLKPNKSKLGKIFMHRTVVKEKILKWSISRSGYVNICTAIEGSNIQLRHTEVALTWIGQPPDNSYVVDHINGIRNDNRVFNLRWVTRSQNSANTPYERVTGKLSARFTGSVIAYDKDTKEIVAIMSGNKEMKENGFDYRLVSAVLKGKRNYHNGCIFEKVDELPNSESFCESMSKTTFKPLDFIDQEGNIVFEVNTYDELVEKGFIPHNVFRVVRGLSKTHRGFIIKIKGE